MNIKKSPDNERLFNVLHQMVPVVTNRLLADAVRRTHCRSIDCESSGTKARICSVFTF